MLGDEGVEVVFYRPPGRGVLDMDRGEGEPCESAEIDGIAKGLKEMGGKGGWSAVISKF